MPLRVKEKRRGSLCARSRLERCRVCGDHDAL